MCIHGWDSSETQHALVGRFGNSHTSQKLHFSSASGAGIPQMGSILISPPQTQGTKLRMNRGSGLQTQYSATITTIKVTHDPVASLNKIRANSKSKTKLREGHRLYAEAHADYEPCTVKVDRRDAQVIHTT
jgi:hypothetical protein